MLVLSILYSVAALVVTLCGLNTLLMLILYLRHRLLTSRRWAWHHGKTSSLSVAAPPEPDTWPVVTVQLPLYNEKYVVERLIDAITQVDYPHDRLQVQVIDDSTDETTELARERVTRHRARGLDIELIRRTDRMGYKAGALANAMQRVRGEFTVMFDADFMPPRDFLKRTIPHLVADPGLAFVQTRWGYVNADYSILTRAQTIGLDAHYIVSQIARSSSGLIVNFSGTAGVWRVAAIRDAGGWQGDTLIEDTDLSMRAQLSGWRALYLPEVVAPAELPPQVAAWRRQQERWTTGGAQLLFKLGATLLRGRYAVRPSPFEDGKRKPLARAARAEALMRLVSWIGYPMSVLVFLLTPLVVLGKVRLLFNLAFLAPLGLAPVISYFLAQHRLYPDWWHRILYLPVLAALGAGLALPNTVAIARGLSRAGLPFLRTPKFRLERRGDRWVGLQYALAFEWITLGELFLVAYALACIGLAVSTGRYAAVLVLLMPVLGCGYIALDGLRRAGPAWRSRLRARRAEAWVEPLVDYRDLPLEELKLRYIIEASIGMLPPR